VASVERWTGVEVRALRHALRMSLEDFAQHLGVSDRMVSKWEARGETMQIRPTNQAALDTALSRATADVQNRFLKLLGGDAVESDEEAPSTSLPTTQIIRHPTDGREMALVGAGVFLAGTAREPMWLPDFYIDVFPVTNADYERFVTATGHAPPQHWPDRRAPVAIRTHPVVFVTWHDANAYAEWAGKRLPTAQEWEKTARSPHGDVYPWGDQPTPAKCNTRESGIRSTTPVDRYQSGVSVYGVYDLCGNTWEWTSSTSEPDRYELKAGAWTSPFARVTPSTFNDASATMLDDDTGFRCVVLAEELPAAPPPR
jgi:formylglycine-generating enzyme required for sulfatase activity